jgi:asparagine synthase (glutamine-hydrolysing)
MCGILAIYGDDSNHLVKKLITNLRHRGPDSTGIHQTGRLCIGFNRLAINDPSAAGNQPHIHDSLITAINGEIYNHAHLNHKYALGNPGGEDTWVVGPLFEKMGYDVIDHLDGFYSGIMYDQSAGILYTIRDYIGKKGLFLVSWQGHLVVTSEPKALPDISEYSQLPKGLAQIQLDTGEVKTIKQHTIRPPKLPGQSLVERLYSAVLKRIPRSMDFGVFLSGGLDSSILASLIHSHSRHARAKYYILGQQSESTDLNPALSVIKHLGIENYKVISLPVADAVPALIEQMVRITESYNPSIISNGICTYLLSEAARADGQKVIISGEGADELFGGYHYFQPNQEWARTRERLLSDMEFTELRRVDLSCMANSIEARFPFLDRSVYSYALSLVYEDIYDNSAEPPINKLILRKVFENVLPTKITWRRKTSSDVGSGIRRLVVESLTHDGSSEKEKLYEIWKQFYGTRSDQSYNHSYPVFDAAIAQRGPVHR